MHWDDLRFLLAVEREGTLSAAAKTLGVNHTTVSRRLTALEKGVGVRLFDRKPEGYASTQAGADVIAVARTVEEQIQSLDRRVLGQDARLCGNVRLTTVDVLAGRHADVFRDFARRYPGIDLEISADNAPRSLTKREADVALRISNKPPDHLVGRRLLRMEFALYGHRDLIAQVGEDRPYDDYPWMGWDERMGAKLTEQWMARHAPNANIAARVDSSVVMMETMKAGMGIGFMGCYFADDEPDLVRMRPAEPGFGMDLWLLTHEDLRNTARVRALMDHIDDALRPLADAYACKRDSD
jgi:DNA-binding transcriptional LysR family regulator